MKEVIFTNKATITAEGKRHSNHCTSVVAIKADGTVCMTFTSIKDAAESLDINANYISTCMNSETHRTCKGWDFYRTKDAMSIFNRIVNGYNNNARDAQKWREQEAEKKRIRLEEERKRNEILRLQNKAQKLEASVEKYTGKLHAIIDALNDTKMELAALGA